MINKKQQTHTTAIGATDNKAHAVAIQSDGKIVLAGYSYNGTDNNFAVARYNTDGSLDNTFDADGMVTTSFELNSNGRAFAVTVQADGKIVVAGYYTNVDTDRDFALVRYNTNGSLDNTFGSGGIITTVIDDGVDEAQSVVIRNDGKIVVVGYSFDFTTRVFTAVRYNIDGSLDNAFDSDGIVTTSINNNDDAAYSAALQPDGKIVISGYTSGETYDFAIIRYNIDGSLDNSFDRDGIVTTDFDASSEISYAIAIQTDGKILAAGDFDNGIVYDFILVRYKTNGTLDNTFGIDGYVNTEMGASSAEDVATCIALQSDGKILVAGNTNDGSDMDFAIARYNSEITSGIHSTANNYTTFNILPNPFSTKTVLQWNYSAQSATLSIYNYFGQSVKEINNISGETISLSRDNLSSGFYFIQLMEGNKIIFIDKIIITD